MQMHLVLFSVLFLGYLCVNLVLAARALSWDPAVIANDTDITLPPPPGSAEPGISPPNCRGTQDNPCSLLWSAYDTVVSLWSVMSAEKNILQHPYWQPLCPALIEGMETCPDYGDMRKRYTNPSVSVWNSIDKLSNLALRTKATAYRVFDDFDPSTFPSQAVDGDLTTNALDSHDETKFGWIQVALPSLTLLANIFIQNRRDCCQNLLPGTYIMVFNREPSGTSRSDLELEAVWSREIRPAKAADLLTFSFVLNKIEGQFIRIVHDQASADLNIAEIIVIQDPQSGDCGVSSFDGTGLPRLLLPPEPFDSAFLADYVIEARVMPTPDPKNPVNMPILSRQTTVTRDDRLAEFCLQILDDGRIEFIMGATQEVGLRLQTDPAVVAPPNKWTDLQVVVKGSRARIFVNGEEKAVGMFSGTRVSGIGFPLVVGSYGSSGSLGSNLVGRLDRNYLKVNSGRILCSDSAIKLWDDGMGNLQCEGAVSQTILDDFFSFNGLQFSLSFWIVVTEPFTRADRAVLHKGSNSTNRRPGIFLSANSNSLYGSVSLIDSTEFGSDAQMQYELNMPTHIAMTVDTQTLRIYKNGAVAAEKYHSTGQIIMERNVGQWNLCGSPWYSGMKGFLRDIQYFSKSLTPAQVLSISAIAPNDFPPGNNPIIPYVDLDGWILVRRQVTNNIWFKATDHLLGTDHYGKYIKDPLTMSNFAIRYSSWDYDEFKFSTGDGTNWLVCDKTQVFKNGAPFQAMVKQSSYSTDSYTALWYNTPSNPEDPTISINANASTILYQGASKVAFSLMINNHMGLNVWVRKAPARKCPNDCSGHGVCNTATGSCACQLPYYLGAIADCSVRYCVYANGTDCNYPNGVCDATTGQCNCNRPFVPGPNGDCSAAQCPNDCFGHGQCETRTGICTCNEPYELGPGMDCFRAHCPRDCSGHGHCDTASGNCNCNAPFQPPDCSAATCTNNCSGHGTCDTGAGVCFCTPPYTLGITKDCSAGVCPGNCSGHGTCDARTGVCFCIPPWVSQNCSIRPCPKNCIDEQHGICDITSGNCQCHPPFVLGTNKDCAETACPNGCTDPMHGDCDRGTGLCVCSDPWTGSDCGTFKPVADYPWTYSNTTWLVGQCLTGKRQSPIDVPVDSVSRPELHPLWFKYSSSTIVARDTGYAVRLDMDQSSQLRIWQSNGSPKVYTLRHVEFHVPSQHRLGSVQYPVEMDLIHIEKSDIHNPTYANVAVFMDSTIVNNNRYLDTILPYLQDAKRLGPLYSYLQPHEANGEQISLIDLLPEDQSYYVYQGSIAIPPCTQNVQWYVMKYPVAISQEQTANLRSIYSGNIRNPQPLNSRHADRFTDFAIP